MRLTESEINKLGVNLKSWTSRMQIAAKSEGAPIFKLKGPCQLVVRKRPTRSGTVATVSGKLSFMGGESFRIGSLSVEKQAIHETWLISLSLTPVDMELVGAISGMTLTLVEAIELFDDMEEWVENCMNGSKDVINATATLTKAKPRMQEKSADNPLWGSW